MSFAGDAGVKTQKSVDRGPFGMAVDEGKVSWDFVPEPPLMTDPKVEPIGALPVSTQEYKLLEDLLDVMMGVDGAYVRSQPLLNPHGERTFKIDETADPSLRDMVKKVLPLCSHYSTVMRFTEEKRERGQGMVNQALAAALHNLLDDYFTLVIQLEHKLLHERSLTLPKAWFYVQPALAYMAVLATCANAVWAGNCHGGKTLGVLHEQATSLTGDTKAKEICLYLTKKAAEPYFAMLESWVYRGRIEDPFKEFLVGDKTLIKKEDMSIDSSDNYWNSRYTLRLDMVPSFMKPIKDRIFATGKYQNVILQCGQRPTLCGSGDDRLCYSPVEREYSDKIDEVYHKASRMLLNLLMDKVDLMGRLRSVKHFFLMDQGDFVVQFMDMAEEELSQNIDDIVPTRLELLLQLSLSTSSVSNDRYKDCVKHQILECSLVSQMEKIMASDTPDQHPPPEAITGYEAFTLNYDVEWPLNLVLTTSSLGCYQMVFRYLFYCTHVERMLSKVWVHDKGAKLRSAAYPVAAFGLRQCMLHFVKSLQYFVTAEVIDPSWHAFQERMQKVQTIDEVLELHTQLTDSFVNLCLLTNYPVFRLIHEALQQCLQFASVVLDDADSGKFDERVNHCQRSFHTLLSMLRKKLVEGRLAIHQGREANLAELLRQIDFNRFFSSVPEQPAAAAT
ncbi:hypothetical protein V5799_007733 [Amblyomma americanum]|uniref:Gamma-tubulin complex component n=1 Tax=Amblyomma americanum TaxID=6943 RepID=A0AAQ4FF91_AMBAM